MFIFCPYFGLQIWNWPLRCVWEWVAHPDVRPLWTEPAWCYCTDLAAPWLWWWTVCPFASPSRQMHAISLAPQTEKSSKAKVFKMLKFFCVLIIFNKLNKLNIKINECLLSRTALFIYGQCKSGTWSKHCYRGGKSNTTVVCLFWLLIYLIS